MSVLDSIPAAPVPANTFAMAPQATPPPPMAGALVVFMDSAGVAKIVAPDGTVSLFAAASSGLNGVRGSRFLGGVATVVALPSVDGSVVMPGDYAYVLADGKMYVASWPRAPV